MIATDRIVALESENVRLREALNAIGELMSDSTDFWAGSVCDRVKEALR